MASLLAIPNLLQDRHQLVVDARQRFAVAVNSELAQLYWQIIRRIAQGFLRGERATCCKQVLVELAAGLTLEFGEGWYEKHLRHSVQLPTSFPTQEILYILCRELSWSHLKILSYIQDTLKKEIYVELCQLDRWSVPQRFLTKDST